eukprot:SAG22_NODE_1013_length_6027_cov_4.804318_3_plen_643_part_00
MASVPELRRVRAGGQGPASQAAAAAAVVEAVREDGACIVEGLFDGATIGTMSEAVLEKARRDAATDGKPGSASQGYAGGSTEVPDWVSEFVGENTVRFSSLGKIGGDETRDAFFTMLDNSLYKRVADAVLLPYAGTYWVNTAQAMLIGPGSAAQPLHRDADNWSQVFERVWAGADTPDLTISAMIALEPVTRELGATLVVPGSNRDASPGGSHEDNALLQEDNAFGDRAEAIQSRMAAAVPAELLQPGDAVLYSGNVLHAGGANVTEDRWRMAMHLSFCAGWLTPEESSALDYTTQELELCGASDHVRQVLGHCSYDPMKIQNKPGDPAGGGGLWLRHVRRIEDYAFSGPGAPRLRQSAAGQRLAAVATHVVGDGAAPAAAVPAAAPPAAKPPPPPPPTVGLLGLPSDLNSTFLRGTAAAPVALRAALVCDSANSYAELGDSFTEIVHDCGDAVLPAGATPAEADRALEAAVAAVLGSGLVPLLVGGDHSVTWPAFRALAAHLKAAAAPGAAAGAPPPLPLAIVHFDAHPDLYEDVGAFMPAANAFSHASPFARIMEAGLCSTLVQLGCRTLNPHQRAQRERFGVRGLDASNWPDTRAALWSWLDDALPRDCLVYITIDADALDPAFAPGVSHYEPGGLSTR